MSLKPHENGVAEQCCFRTKTAIEQALLWRSVKYEELYLRDYASVTTPCGCRMPLQPHGILQRHEPPAGKIFPGLSIP